MTVTVPMLSPFRLITRVVERFNAERFAQVAASLSFSTLLGLVPLIAVGLALIIHLPFSAGMSAALEKFLLANLLPDKAGIIIARYLEQFAHKAERLTLIGGLWLAVTALMQMLTIEHAFNAIWRVKAKRPFLRRVVMHLVALMLGPLLFGGSLWVIGFITGVSFGLVDEPQWLNTLFFRFLPLVFMTALFALLYHAVPNRNVSKWHAFGGGLFATFGFSLMQRLFGMYVAKFPTYTMIYGAFSAVPIFLVWLYLSWSVVLIGALIVAEMPGATHSPKR
jgi:membrane protein